MWATEAETISKSLTARKKYFFWRKILEILKLVLHLHSQMNKWPVRLGVRTSDFHSGNRGSIPLRATESDQRKVGRFFCFWGLVVLCLGVMYVWILSGDLFGFWGMLVVLLYF
jgi:hypothetical protein